MKMLESNEQVMGMQVDPKILRHGLDLTGCRSGNSALFSPISLSMTPVMYIKYHKRIGINTNTKSTNTNTTTISTITRTALQITIRKSTMLLRTFDTLTRLTLVPVIVGLAPEVISRLEILMVIVIVVTIGC